MLTAHTGPALGLEADARYEVREIQLAAGDRLLLYTDGLLGSGAESIASDDLTRTLCSGIDRAELPGTLYRTATQKITGERDDITLILLERGEGVSHFDHTAGAEERPTPQRSTTQAQLLYGVRGKQAFISIAGTVSWVSSQAFLDTANKLLERHKKLTIDLAACEYMDSTCLGTLHEIVISRPDAVYLQRMPANIRELFEELSMEAVLSRESPSSDPLPGVMESLPQKEIGVPRQCARILRAHETLASLSPENREKFQSVIDSLREDSERNR